MLGITNKSNRVKYLILCIPIFYLFWSIFLNHLAGPFSTSRSDPEYIYLMNGLNCALLKFNMIGHIDNPGTPIQLLTGLFIRITHLLSGQRPIVEDVISRPDAYIMWASVYLSIITGFLLYWLGNIAWKYTNSVTATLILQSSILLNPIFIDVPLRYNPDRILILFVILFIILCISYFLSGKVSHVKFSILSGILMGIGVASKFNFLPLIIIPFFLLPKGKNRWIFVLTFFVSGALSISPIWNKFSETRRFFTNLVTHDGLYGQGSSRIINLHSFIDNLGLIFQYNISFSIIAIAAIIFFALWIFKAKKPSETRWYYIFLALFLASSMIGMIMVAKHFKNYYLAPVIALSGFVLFLIWEIVRTQYKFRHYEKLFAIILLILIIISFYHQYPFYQKRIEQNRASIITQNYIIKNISTRDLWFIEPTWLAGPMVENALSYGISWVAHRHQLYDDFHRIYPHVITWEGEGHNPKWFRTVEADPESILKCGRDIYLYSSPGRNAGVLLNWLDTLAAQTTIRIEKDTVFVNPENEDMIIRVRNKDGWGEKATGKLPIVGGSVRGSGLEVLNPSKSVSEKSFVIGVEDGDYIEVTVCVLNQDAKNPGRLILKSIQSDSDGIYFEDSHSLQDIGDHWQLLRLRGRIQNVPLNGRMECMVYYPGQKELKIRDLEIRHMGKTR